MTSEINKYLNQYRDIYDSNLLINNDSNSFSDDILNCDLFSLQSFGNTESKFVFVEDFFIDNKDSFNIKIRKSHDLFEKILKSIGLSIKNIQIIRISRFTDLNINSQIYDLFNKMLNNKKIIISLNAKFLNKKNNIKFLRSNFSKYNKVDLMYTYHPQDLIINSKLKRLVWDDFKLLRDKYLNG